MQLVDQQKKLPENDGHCAAQRRLRREVAVAEVIFDLYVEWSLIFSINYAPQPLITRQTISSVRQSERARGIGILLPGISTTQ